MKFKNDDVIRTILEKPYDKKLINILLFLLNSEYGESVIITEGYREQIHKNDLHGVIPVRAIDIRSRVFKDPLKVCNLVNNTFYYDKSRPEKVCAMFHDIGKGEHIHLQVHPNTVRIK